jgi:hypothetical protein
MLNYQRVIEDIEVFSDVQPGSQWMNYGFVLIGDSFERIRLNEISAVSALINKQFDQSVNSH